MQNSLRPIVTLISAIFFSLLSVASFLLFARTIYLRSTKNAALRPRFVYLLCFLFCNVRASYHYIQVFYPSFWTKLLTENIGLMVIVDLIPESLAFCTYLLLLFILIELYYQSGRYKTDPKLKLKIWMCFGFVMITSWIAFIGYAIWIPSKVREEHDMQVFYFKYVNLFETICVSVQAFILVVAFGIYGFLLIGVLKASLLPKEQKKKIVSKMQALEIVCTICYFLHAVGMIVTHYWVDNRWKDASTWFVLINGLITEFVPFCCILMLLGFIFRKGGQTPKKNKQFIQERAPLTESRESLIDSDDESSSYEDQASKKGRYFRNKL